MKLRVVHKNIQLRNGPRGTKIYREGDEFEGSPKMLEKLAGRIEAVEEPAPEPDNKSEVVDISRIDSLRELADRIGMPYKKQWREKRLKREIEAFADVEGIDITGMISSDIWGFEGDE